MNLIDLRTEMIKSYMEKWTFIDVEYEIRKDGKVDVSGTVNIRNFNGTELPFKFGKVSEWFDCSKALNLTTLKGTPDEVGENFNCSYLKNLKSLEDGPKKVNGWYKCHDCGVDFSNEDLRKSCDVKGTMYNI